MNIGNPANVPTIPKDMDAEAIRRFWRNPLKEIFTPQTSSDRMESRQRPQANVRGTTPSTLTGLRTPER